MSCGSVYREIDCGRNSDARKSKASDAQEIRMSYRFVTNCLSVKASRKMGRKRARESTGETETGDSSCQRDGGHEDGQQRCEHTAEVEDCHLHEQRRRTVLLLLLLLLSG